MNFHAPQLDYAGLSPLIALTVGTCVVLLSGVFERTKRAAPALTLIALAAAAGLLIWQWDGSKLLVSGALRLDDLAISISLIAVLSAAFTVFYSLGEPAAEQARARGVPRAAAWFGARHGPAVPGAEPDQLLRRDRDPLDPALHPLRRQPAPRALAGVGA